MGAIADGGETFVTQDVKPYQNWWIVLYVTDIRSSKQTFATNFKENNIRIDNS